MENVSSTGVLTIESRKDKKKVPCKGTIKDFDNEMDFYFPTQIKTEIFLDFGVGDAFIDLTDISVTKLNINCGLSDVELEINERNKVNVIRLILKVGWVIFLPQVLVI